jgi:Fe-S-cluster containining protein
LGAIDSAGENFMSVERYLSLRDKLDAKAQELSQRHAAALHCQRGCHSCCLPELSVFPIEARVIQDFLHESGKRQEVLALEAADPFAGERCAFLAADGGCSIYPVRPLVCRSHGLPLQFRNEADELSRDVCPLNFTEQTIANLPGEAVLNLDLINALLTLINAEAYGPRAAERISLVPSAVCEADLTFDRQE